MALLILKIAQFLKEANGKLIFNKLPNNSSQQKTPPGNRRGVDGSKYGNHSPQIPRAGPV
jgi:hypothetical protein